MTSFERNDAVAATEFAFRVPLLSLNVAGTCSCTNT